MKIERLTFNCETRWVWGFPFRVPGDDFKSSGIIQFRFTDRQIQFRFVTFAFHLSPINARAFSQHSAIFQPVPRNT